MILPRQQNYGGFYCDSFWCGDTGLIVKWSLAGGIVAIVLLWIVGGYWHAQRRIRKGLPPLAYHRCLVARRYYAPTPNRYGPPQPIGAYGQEGYNMNQMPPPIYDPTRPPEYTAPPPDGTKVDPNQHRQEPQRSPFEGPANDVQPPAGPPPGHYPTRYG